jgi:hypothetical protein
MFYCDSMSDWKMSYRHWEGTAAELADFAAQVLKALNVPEDSPTPNERLVRNYVQLGILERPERRGKEAHFGFRQLVEFLAARALIADRWPLTKIAEFVRTSSLEALLDLVPESKPSNRAQELVARFKCMAPLTRDMPPPHTAVMAQSVGITKTRQSLRETLEALGNAGGRPERREAIQISLTPWCQVHIEAHALQRMTAETIELLGQALTQTLLEELVRTGGKKP